MVEAPSGELAAFDVIVPASVPAMRKGRRALFSTWPYARIEHAQRDDACGKHGSFDQVVRCELEQRDLREHAKRVAASDQRCESRDVARPYACCPVYGAACKPDEEEPDCTRACDHQRRGRESDADKARDPKDGDGPHEHWSAFFADKTVFKGKGQKAQGAGALNGELQKEGTHVLRAELGWFGRTSVDSRNTKKNNASAHNSNLYRVSRCPSHPSFQACLCPFPYCITCRVAIVLKLFPKGLTLAVSWGCGQFLGPA